MRVLAIIALGALAACGADGEPEPIPARETGISISGEARIGVSGSF